LPHMPDKPSKPAPRLSPKGQKAHLEREERRAVLLRQNLQKRKMQQRSRSTPDDGPADKC
jgi:hypothetical protein